MLSIKKILCPTDFSEPSYRALDAANDLAKIFESEIVLIHVLSPVFIYPAAELTPGILKTSSINDISRDEMAYKSLSMTLKDRVPDSIRSRSILEKGNPAEEIVKSAKAEKADLIVIGTHGFTGWRHFILGSVAEKVVRLSPCPVFTVPANREPVVL